MRPKSRMAILFVTLLVLALTINVFADLVTTYNSTDDTWSEYTVVDTETNKEEAGNNSLIDNGDFTEWGTELGPSDPWTFWKDATAGWTAGRLHEVDVALPANPDGINNAMGWFIQHSGAKEGGYFAGAYQQLTRIPAEGLYYVNISGTAFSDGKTGPYNSVAWYGIGDSADLSSVTEWRELFPDQYVCDNGAGVCNYIGRDETIILRPNQFFHVQVGRKFPEFFGWTMFIIDDISIVAADGTLNTENGFYNWCNGTPEDFKFHENGSCVNLTEVHWDTNEVR